MTRHISHFHIREPAISPFEGDVDFILDAFDSTLPHLASIGSGAQWGSEPARKRGDFLDVAREMVEKESKKGKPVKIFIAEVGVEDEIQGGPSPQYRVADDGTRFVLVGLAIVHTTPYVPGYIKCDSEAGWESALEDVKKSQEDMWIDVLVTDFRAGGQRKGAGAAMLQRAKEYAKGEGKSALWLDCWAGNERKLVNYYRSQGYAEVGDFIVRSEKGDEPDWPGTCLKLDV